MPRHWRTFDQIQVGDRLGASPFVGDQSSPFTVKVIGKAWWPMKAFVVRDDEGNTFEVPTTGSRFNLYAVIK